MPKQNPSVAGFCDILPVTRIPKQNPFTGSRRKASGVGEKVSDIVGAPEPGGPDKPEIRVRQDVNASDGGVAIVGDRFFRHLKRAAFHAAAVQ